MKRINFPSLIKTVAAAYSVGAIGLAVAVLSANEGGDQSAHNAVPAKGDFVKGASMWANTCQRCHNMRDPKELDDSEWKAVVTHMRLRAGLTGQDARDILAFLQQSNDR